MLSEADQHLMELIGCGDADGWQKFIDRFEGRLLAFAVNRVASLPNAEDLVQETFVAFLGAMTRFRQETELETFLFQILRRKIIDHYRAKGSCREIPACVLAENAPEPLTRGNPDNDLISQEANSAALLQLASAIGNVTSRLRDQKQFRDLKIAEGVFYAMLKNRDLSSRMNCDVNEIARVKHRLLQRLAAEYQHTFGPVEIEPLGDDLLSKAWEHERPSCPKRTTLGKYVLGILPDDWDDYVRFHVEQLGCSYCTANLSELKTSPSSDKQTDSSSRLFQSTIGFLSR